LRRIADGELAAIRDNRMLRIHQNELEKFLARKSSL